MGSGRSAWALAAVVLLVPCSSGPLTHATGSQPDGQTREVIFAIQRHHRLQVFDAETLDPLGQVVGLNTMLEHVSVSPNGQTLYLAQAATFDGNECCALFAFSLLTDALCYLIGPAMDSLPSPDGRWLFTERGSVGIDVFDASTLARASTIATFDMRRAHENHDRLPLRGQYALYPSSDGHWMFGITLWQKPSLGIFDLWNQTMVRELPIPVASGAWVGNQFYLYENDGEHARLFGVSSDATGLGTPRPITVSTPGLRTTRLPARAQLIAAGDRLLVYEPVAWWLHGPTPVQSGGIFVIDPANGGLTGHLAPAVPFAQVAVGAKGQRLYGLDAGQPSYERKVQPPRLLALDAQTGLVVAERPLEPDVWHLALALVPASLVPRGDVHPTVCRMPR